MGRWTTEVTLDVAWGEMDALGHVNNIRYIAWVETARIAFFRQLGMATLPGEPGGPHPRPHRVRLPRPVEYPARVTVGIRPEKVGNTSLALAHEIWISGQPERVGGHGAGPWS
jgi:acyl-CoA thioester hydrolase